MLYIVSSINVRIESLLRIFNKCAIFNLLELPCISVFGVSALPLHFSSEIRIFFDPITNTFVNDAAEKAIWVFVCAAHVSVPVGRPPYSIHVFADEHTLA